jgi:hypothetical protein
MLTPIPGDKHLKQTAAGRKTGRWPGVGIGGGFG